MTTYSLAKDLLNLKDFVIEDYTVTPVRNQQAMIVTGHLDKRCKHRCPVCGAICPGYDTNPESRQWRTLDHEGRMVFVEAQLIRVNCPEHGVHVELVPWARPKSRFTRYFEETVAAKAVQMNKSAISEEMRITWSTVGQIIKRIADEKLPAQEELFENLENIGIDETSYRKGHKYLTVVVNHDTGEIIFAKPGHDKKTLNSFFELLTPEQRESILYVSGDGARWIRSSMRQYIPEATFCIDRFHVTQWCLEVMDSIRKAYWRNELDNKKKLPKKGRGRPTLQQRKEMESGPNPSLYKGAKYALGKNPANLTEGQKSKLSEIEKLAPKLFRAWELKEKLREVFTYPPHSVETALNKWLGWACRSRIPEMVELSRKIRRHKENIINTVTVGLSNARIESINNKIKVIIRRSYGFRNIDNLIAMVMLSTSRVKLKFPGRELVGMD